MTAFRAYSGPDGNMVLVRFDVVPVSFRLHEVFPVRAPSGQWYCHQCNIVFADGGTSWSWPVCPNDPWQQR